MDADPNRTVEVRQGAAHRLHAPPDLGRHAPAVGVTQHNPGRPGASGGETDLERVLRVPREAVEEVLRIEDELPAEADPIGHGFLHHRQVLVGRGLQHGADLPRVALADQRPDRRPAFGESAKVGIVFAATVGAPRGAESGESRPLEGVLVKAGEKLLVLGV
jgi:hypothetical protein